MPRRKVIIKRDVRPDPIYNSKLVAKFINCLMIKGKRSRSESVIYKSLGIIEKKTGQNSLEVFRQAINNVKPVLEVKSRRVGGSTYQVPVDVRADRRTSLAIHWIIEYSRDRGEKSMQEKLAGELIDAFKNEGTSIKKKLDTHKMAEANRAFAHYRW